MGFDTASWARFLGIETDSAELCNADLSTVTSQADAILLLGKEQKKAAHVEVQASYDATIDIRIVLYYALGFKTLGIPLTSFLVLLRPEADGPGITGVVRHVDEDGKLVLEFYYTVIRVWELKAEELIESGLGVLPLAFIADANEVKLPELVKRAAERLEREAKPGTIGEFWTSIDILMGLKFSRAVVENALKGVRAMKESVTYQAILEEGEAKGVIKGALGGKRATLLKLGTKLWGAPDAVSLATLEAIDSMDRLDELVLQCWAAKGWAELMGLK